MKRIVDEEVARRVCELIAGILLTDEEFHPAENDLLNRMLEGFGMALDRETALTPALSRVEAVKAIRELPAEVRDAALELLIDAAIVDGKVVPDEQKYLQAVADAVGLSAEDLDTRVTERLMKG